MKHLLTISLFLITFSAFSQTGNFDYLTSNRRFTLAGRTVKGISNDTTWLIGSADSLVTQYAVKGYISNVFGPGATFGYNFNPSDFIVSGYDISIRFPQDPGEPLFTNSPAFNLTQQHIEFLDSLMLALRDSNYTYFADRDFYGTGKGTSPFFTKSFTLTTTGTGAASWDSTTKVLNIPVASSGPGGGGSLPYYLPYNGDSSSYIGGDTLLHHLPPQPPPGDSIDYSFTSLTTFYNEYGPGEALMTPNSISANPDNTNFPFRQLKSLDIGGWTSSSYISFTKNTTFSTTAFTFLRAFIRLKSVVDIPSSLSFRFYLNGSPISSIISCVNYGLTKNKVGSYMNISIPLTAFGFTSNNFDELRFEFGGSNNNGLYMDLVQLQNASIDENKYVTDVHRIPGTVTVQQVLGGQNVFAFNDSIGGNAGTVTWLGTTYNINNGNNVTLATPTTSNIAEGSNLYYTDTRSRAAISVTGSGSYDNTTGVINITGGSSAGWALGGNTLANSGTQYLGTNNLTSVRIRTNFVERLLIDSLGNIGINTTTPKTKLDLSGTFRVTGASLPASGAGMELQYISSSSGIFSYDRTASAYKELTLDGSLIALNRNSNAVVQVGTGAPSSTGILQFIGNNPKNQIEAGYFSLSAYANNQIQLSDNLIGSKYRFAGTGTALSFYNGEVLIQTAPTGTAGGTATLTTVAKFGNAGTLMTRITTTQRDAITGTALVEGLEIYNLTTHQKNYYNGTAWIAY